MEFLKEEDKYDSHFDEYEIYLHDISGDILAGIYRKNGELVVIKLRITKEIATRLFSEFRREVKISEVMDEEI